MDILAADAAGHKAEADAALRALNGRKINHAAAESAFADLHKALAINAARPDTESAALEHFERQHGQHLGPAPTITVQQAAAKARLHAAAPDLLAELLAAHRLLQIMLSCLTPAGRFKFAAASEREGLGADGATRHHERTAAIARATGVKS